MGKLLYHYTNIDGAIGIRNEERINECCNKRDKFGAGVYLTALKPEENTKEKILHNNYGPTRNGVEDRADMYVIVDSDQLDANKLVKVDHLFHNFDVYLYSDSIPVMRCDVYDNSNCLKWQSYVNGCDSGYDSSSDLCVDLYDGCGDGDVVEEVECDIVSESIVREEYEDGYEGKFVIEYVEIEVKDDGVLDNNGYYCYYYSETES